MSENSHENLRITAITPAQAAKILSAVYRRRITQQQIHQIAETGGLLRSDGTINLVHYTAWLIKETASGGGKKDASGGSRGEANGN